MRSAALIVVNYKTAALAIDAIRTARAATASTMQVIVVDNSVDPREAALLAPHADVLIASERNVGYAAAINSGRKAADAAVLVVSNPDVRFDSGSIDRLVETDAAVAGPALYWDDAHEWILPPSELQTTTQELDRAVASRSGAWARWRDRRRIRARLAFWSLTETTAVKALSGAVLAIDTAAFDRAGGFDERFPLYFEENDFLRRVAGRIAYVPTARCRHIYNQSAGGSADAAALFDRSRSAYLEKWSGRTASRMLQRLERRRETSPALPLETVLRVPEGALVEASPLVTFDTAAGYIAGSSDVRIPPEVWASYRNTVLYVRIIDPRTAEEVATYARSKIDV